MHIEARDLTFTDEPDEWHKASFDVMAVTYGDNGAVLDQLAKTHTVRVRGESYKRALRDGFVYVLTVPIKKPGAYQLRTALRDIATEHVGSASQFIEVPNIGKNRLTLSGIIISGTDPSAKTTSATADAAGKTPASGATGARGGDSEEVIQDMDPQAGPAVRRFHRGMILQYGYVVYNAVVDKGGARPQLQVQMRVFRDGREVFTGRVQPFDASGQTDLKRITAGGALQLGNEMMPGEYILQVIVTDPLAKDKYRTATQWIDFEIVK
jgi:hypothetical protein